MHELIGIREPVDDFTPPADEPGELVGNRRGMSTRARRQARTLQPAPGARGQRRAPRSAACAGAKTRLESIFAAPAWRAAFLLFQTLISQALRRNPSRPRRRWPTLAIATRLAC